MNKNKSKIKKILKLIISLGLLVLILLYLDSSEIIEQFRYIDPLILLVAFIFWMFGIFISSFKWSILLKVKKENLSYLKLVKYYFIGTFFNRFLPTNVGGDAVRAYSVSKEMKNKREAYSSIYVERLTGLLILVFLGFIFSLIYWDFIIIEAKLLIYFFFIPLTILILFVSFTKKGLKLFLPFYRTISGIINKFFDSKITRNLEQKIISIHDSVIGYRKESKILFYSLILSLFYHLSLAIRVWLLSGTLGNWIPIYYFLFFVPLIDLLLYAPISIRGLGVREGLFLYFFGGVGIDGILAVSIALLFEIVDSIVSAIGGIVYFYNSLRR